MQDMWGVFREDEQVPHLQGLLREKMVNYRIVFFA